ncbi:hypothetical protein [Glaciimonas sp. PAMC28666]|uniref:hypothetical protein n=1 Tax=Glaciimonas sp. PAMC28666 TaxID=2807626 RepID=UPI001963DFAB|nr:hypothetical protein [Glaciimonas sp. PAMC28666]QRX81010.1 hypothetical protein JQN73_12385 [Glaciimonas sp. PAMC28666]
MVIKQKLNGLGKYVITLGILWVIFYLGAYTSVSPGVPSSIPVHHDDYTNYAATTHNLSWGVRPLSGFLISALSSIGPNFLIWTIRFLAVIYVFLCLSLFELTEPKNYRWWLACFFAVLLFSSPMVVEYSRYTGMITHLVSGCLGVVSVIYLRKAFSNNSLRFAWMALIAIILSVTAKEDFLVLFAFSYLYLFLSFSAVKEVRLIGLAGLLIASSLVIAFKVFSATQFLGVVSQSSSYYVNISPVSIAKTMVEYLSGANHPAMYMHGNMVIACVFITLLMTLISKKLYRLNALYFLGCAFSVMLPYSLLPNHVNAYYEYIWLPFLFIAAYCSVIGGAHSISSSVKWTRIARYVAPIVLILSAILVANIDFSGRKSVAAWYDQRAQESSAVLASITEQSLKARPNDALCVLGANEFSPWYMHNGEYLSRVMGLEHKWFVYVPKNSKAYPGFEIGALSSKGWTTLESDYKISSDCYGKTVDLRPLNTD